MMRTRFELILCVRMTVDKAARHTVFYAFFLNKWSHYTEFADVLKYFSHRIVRLKFCSVVLLPALNPVCS